MNILHKYILRTTLRNFLVASLMFCLLFLVFDFFDRIDNVLDEGSNFSTIALYFILKIPGLFVMTLPFAMLMGTMFTIGLLSKNSEMTAMRSNGLTVFWLTKPILYTALALSFVCILLNESIVPFCNRRVEEIYNIDIKKRDEKGTFDKDNFWWREGDNFFSAVLFDSRTSSVHKLSKFYLNKDFLIDKRTDSEKTTWVNSQLGWNMKNITERKFELVEEVSTKNFEALPAPEITLAPKDFFSFKSEPETMTFMELLSFIKAQKLNGLPVKRYYPDLFSKLAFPFIVFVITLITIPFALIPARTGSMATSFMSALSIGFLYYVIHSLSLAFGKAEIWPALLAAFAANILLASVGLVLNLGSEAPS